MNLQRENQICDVENLNKFCDLIHFVDYCEIYGLNFNYLFV